MPTLPHHRGPRPSAVLAAIAALVISSLLVAASPPAGAAAPDDTWVSPTMDADCAGPLECLILTRHVEPAGGGPAQVEPSLRAWTFEPVPVGDEGQPGWYRIRPTDTDHFGTCLTVGPRGSGTGPGPDPRSNNRAGLESCLSLETEAANWSQLWRIEPVGEGAQRSVDPAAWDPWSSFTDLDADGFWLMPAAWGDGARGDDKCFTLGAENPSAPYDVLDERVPCNHGARLSLHRITDPQDNGHKTDAIAQRASATLLGGAFANADWFCTEENKYQDWCKVRVADRNAPADDPDDGWISEWSRFGAVILTKAPTRVVAGTGCAGGAGTGGAQAIYNSGQEPVTTTISASASNSASHSLTEGLSISASFGIKAKFFTAGVEVTRSTEFGQTWSETEEVSQSISWTIPPRQYATAVILTDAVNLTATWQFGPDGSGSWRLVNGAALDLPYSATATAVAPDTIMSVHNSWHRKDCNATQPSNLAEGKAITVSNADAPGKAPIVGDTLIADAGTSTGDDAWWHIPSAGDDAPVTLRYQWYRVRSGESARPIPGAVGETTDPGDITYTVTSDDVTDPEVLEQFGPYHLYVGVTDIADQTRFDSLEYTSVATGGITEGPRRIAEGHLELAIANPDTVATTDTRIDLAASITGGDGPVNGEVTLLDGDQELTTVSLTNNGTATVWLPLTTGPHDLTAVYGGEGPLDGVRSSTVRTTVTAAPSTTNLTARDTVAVGTEATLRADVTGVGPTPTGTVEFFDGPKSLAEPVPLTDGTAVLVAPGLSIGESRDLWAAYSGDALYAGSGSEQTRQSAARAPTRTRVRVPNLPTAQGDRVRLRSKVSGPRGAVPSGRVVFFADGRRVGAGQVNPRGVATVRTRELPRGRTVIWARYVPPAGSDFAGSRSDSATHRVRRHASRVRAEPRKRQIERGRVAVTGVVQVPARPRAHLRGRVWVQHSGQRIQVGRINRNGEFRLRVRARDLEPGRNVLTVVYRGSQRPSVAASRTKVVIRRR